MTCRVCVNQLLYDHCSSIAGDLTNELVRHFLIESSPKGVKLKGCPNEPYFGKCDLAAKLQSLNLKKSMTSKPAAVMVLAGSPF